LWDNDQQQLWHRLLEGVSSPLCEVLGLQQRRWLQQQLQGSKAALNVIASGSVLAGARRAAGRALRIGQALVRRQL
jgi:phosphodiesterase/alkaline phosphatase D-like protein